jgi:hypothetical protein
MCSTLATYPLDDEVSLRLTDEEAKEIIFHVTKCASITEFQGLGINKRNIFIKKLKEKGLSISQISRLTGISKSIVEKQ